MGKGRGQQPQVLLKEQVDNDKLDVFSDLKAQSTLELLHFIKDDYCQAKKQLEDIYFAFRDRELHTEKQLKALITSDISTSLEANHRTSNIKIKDAGTSPLTLSTSIRAYCFGSFELYINGNRIQNWHSQKAKTLFKFMVTCKKQPITRELLIETLWPDCDPDIGRNNLKTAIYSLRQTLSPGSDKDLLQIILYTEGQYMINPEINIWIDIDEFEHNWLAGRVFEKGLEKDKAKKKYYLAQALYRGDYFGDDPYLDWTLLSREALKDTYLAILGKLAQSSFEEADDESCIIYSQKILEKDICHEEAYRWLIKCYFRLGQHHRAKQWYNVCANTLKRELQINPDRQTTVLYYHLLNQITSL